MALTKQDLKEIRAFQANLKNSGMNPWGNLKRGKDMKMTNMGRPKKASYPTLRGAKIASKRFANKTGGSVVSVSAK